MFTVFGTINFSRLSDLSLDKAVEISNKILEVTIALVENLAATQK